MYKLSYSKPLAKTVKREEEEDRMLVNVNHESKKISFMMSTAFLLTDLSIHQVTQKT